MTSISREFSKVSRLFFITLVGLSVLLVAFLTLALYEANAIRFSGTVSSDELYALVENDQAVTEYLESENAFEAHFTAIASLVQQNQQESLTRVLVVIAIPAIVLSALVGFLAARYLLRPVRMAYESQERFLQDAAHELRNPLAAMSLTLENAKASSSNDKELIKTMNRQTNRLIRINEDLLYLERHVVGTKIPVTNISELLGDILEDVQPNIAHKKLIINTNINQDISFKIHPTDFIKLAKNIVENAIKYSEQGTEIGVSLTKDKNISLVVEDQGMGIPPEAVAKIGQRFFRAQNATQVTGSGLGIAIVKKVLNTYGGHLHIDSLVGRGTTVRITL